MGSLFIQKSAVSKKARFRVQSCIATLYILRDISKLFWKLWQYSYVLSLESFREIRHASSDFGYWRASRRSL